MVFDLIVSALVTVLVVTLTDGILTFFGNGPVSYTHLTLPTT